MQQRKCSTLLPTSGVKRLIFVYLSEDYDYMGLFRWTDYDLMTTCMIISKLKSPDVEDFLCVCFCTGFGIYSNMYQYTGPVPADRESPMTRSETSPSRAQHPSPTQKPNTCCFCWCCCCSCSWYDPLTCLCLHMVHSTHHRC